MKKFLFITIGVLSVILGIIGIFVPGLPTTPFILLSSWLFYKSSKRLHDRLHRSPLGKYIRRYESRQGMSLTGKFISIACMWIMISISAFLILEDFKIRVLLLILSSWLFYKSSKRLHDRLHRSPLGKYIRRYESRQGMSLTGKFISIACMWIMISISAFLILEDFKIRVLLLILGAIGTGSILLIVPTAKRQNPGSEEAR